MLCTVDDVIDAVGGPAKAASLTGVVVSAISNWKADGRIPKRHLFVFWDALPDVEIDRAVFGFASEGARP